MQLIDVSRAYYYSFSIKNDRIILYKYSHFVERMLKWILCHVEA